MLVFRLGPICLLFGGAVAQNFNLTIDSSTCIAPSEYKTVNDGILEAEATCIRLAGVDGDAVIGCGCGGFVEKMNNFASACWNRIYGCEYQSLVAQYFDLCPIASVPVPYWPAPDNAPGSCACNTGTILETYAASIKQSTNCIQNATSLSTQGNFSLASEMDIACSCCSTGITISAMYDICPTTDPKLIGLNQIIAAVALETPWSSCGPSLTEFDCVNDLHFVAPLGTGKVYNPTDLPASGTQTLSNIAGEVTSPASGAVFTYSAVGSEWTVTALSINAKEATATGAGTATASNGEGPAATGTSASGSSGTKSGVAKVELGLCSLALTTVLCAAVLAI